MRNRRTMTALAALLLAACSGSNDEPGARQTMTTHPEGNVGSLDHPPVDPARVVVSASAQRLSVEQLRRTFPIVMGNDAKGEGITWLDGKKPGLDVDSDTLGEADYIMLTDDIKDPSPLYVKLMDDAARSVCGQALDMDYATPDAAQRTLLRLVDTADTLASNAAGVDKNLKMLKLRMHGVKIAESDTTTIAPLRTLFTSVVDGLAQGAMPTEAQVKEGWRAVCVALLTAPEFHLY